jgi:hypothetical protein
MVSHMTISANKPSKRAKNSRKQSRDCLKSIMTAKNSACTIYGIKGQASHSWSYSRKANTSSSDFPGLKNSPAYTCQLAGLAFRHFLSMQRGKSSDVRQLQCHLDYNTVMLTLFPRCCRNSSQTSGNQCVHFCVRFVLLP